MIREFLRPATLNEALALKEQYGDNAVYMAGGARLNATPTRTDREIVISLAGLKLKGIEKTNRGWEIGALSTLQEITDNNQLPAGLREAAQLIFSRNMRQQMTIGGEVVANLDSCQILPALLASGAQVELAEGKLLTLEAFLAQPEGLITKVIVQKNLTFCRSERILKSSASQPIVTVSFVASQTDEASQYGVAISCSSSKIVRLQDAEGLVSEYLSDNISRKDLEAGVSDSVHPQDDFNGSANYKRQMAGVLVGQLVDEFKVRGN